MHNENGKEEESTCPVRCTGGVSSMCSLTEVNTPNNDDTASCVWQKISTEWQIKHMNKEHKKVFTKFKYHK